MPRLAYPLAYPPTRTAEQYDDYHGTRVADPYRWLEDVDSAETRAWVAAQNALTFAYLDEIPARDGLRQRLTELWNYPHPIPSRAWAGQVHGGRNRRAGRHLGVPDPCPGGRDGR